MKGTPSFKWRKWNNILHRDTGYLIVALTLIYGISGVAVNHKADWNPNYTQQKEALSIQPIESKVVDSMVIEAVAKLGLEERPKNRFRPDPETLQLFYDQRTYSVDIPTGSVLLETVQPRRVLFEVNQLHLNTPKNLWTFIADLYAVSLILVAITGLFVLKGKNGLAGRGWWLTLIGLVVPVAYWIWYQWI